MGRLANHTYRQVVKKLKKLGFEFYRQAAGSHELWYHPERQIFTTIPNHPGDIPEGTLRAIVKQAQVTVDDFLKA
uniref:YcfA family protein n=1 Tax=Chlorobium phaeobacteroides (strain BS1) TaxID=331678 RepID=B3EM08_CHLPB